MSPRPLISQILFRHWGFLLILVLATSAFADNERVGEGWSQDLLARLLTAPVSEAALHPPTAVADAMVLRSYQLRALHLGDPGRATHLVSILQRMLPADSRITEDRAANTVHILSTVAAQQAALELISAMDAEGASTELRPEAQAIPGEVQKALEALAAARPDSEQLKKILAESSRQTEERLSAVMRQSQAESKANLSRLLLIGGITALVLLAAGAAGVTAALRRRPKSEVSKMAGHGTAALSTLPAQSLETMLSVSRDQQERTKELQKLMESFSIAYQADRQRNTIIMETVAKKHGELASTLTRMEQLRQDMSDDAGRVFLEVNRHAIDQIISQASEALQTRAAEVGLIAESASRKMEETASRLEVQNAKAAALAEELERTQKEVDGLFEKLKSAQEQAQQAQVEANEQRRIAYEKTLELTKKEAALAGLSLLMQEPVGEILDTLSKDDDPEASSTSTPASPPAYSSSGSSAVPENQTAVPTDSNDDSLLQPPASSSCPLPRYTFRITPVA